MVVSVAARRGAARGVPRPGRVRRPARGRRRTAARPLAAGALPALAWGAAVAVAAVVPALGPPPGSADLGLVAAFVGLGVATAAFGFAAGRTATTLGRRVAVWLRRR
ncbi:hypothetical protein ACFQRB_03820 [Halobaculum litoreum]|uniref:Uncharacterized protein n=1 Tax=Halobaculum litoreum TaxID=3031998 RepID=A0ABD5XS52_9EURY